MFRVRVFGGLWVERDGAPIEGLGARRAALLAALAVAGRRGVSRDRLLLYLWPDSTEERARHNLAQTVYGLHKTLGQEVVESTGHEVRLAEKQVESDVGDLLAAHARGDWAAVASGYQGPLLDGFILSDAAEFDAWLGAERVRLEGIAREAIETTARAADEAGDRSAAKHWRRLVDLDPLTTRYAVGYARALARAADPGSAVLHLREHARRLNGELNLPAPPDLTALVNELTRRAPPDPPVAERRPELPQIRDGPSVAGQESAEALQGAAAAGTAKSAHPPESATAPDGLIQPSQRRWGLILAVLALAAVLSVGFAWSARRPVRAVVDGAMVVLTDIENLTGDSTLGRPLGLALRVGLEQAGNFSVYPRTQLPISLSRMGRTITDTVLGEPLAREIALRELGQAVVAVVLSEVGGRFELSGRIVDPTTGRSLAAHRIGVADRADLLDEVGSLAAWIRRKLGDTRWDSGARLPLVTTSSLPALTAFAGAGAALQRFEWDQAQALLEHALAVDTGFALAQAMLGQFYLTNNRIPEALTWLREADRRVGRLTEPEQLQVKALLARAEGRTDAAIGYTGALAAKYPSAPDWVFYGETLREGRRDQEAVAAFERALAIDSTDLDAYHGIALAQKRLGNYRDALDAFSEIEQRDSTYLLRVFRNQQWGDTHVITGNLAAADSVFRRMLARPLPADRARGHRALAYLAAYRGQFAKAADELRAAIGLQPRGTLSEYRDLVFLADVDRSRGEESAATAALDRAFDIFRRTEIQAAAVMFAGHQLVRARQLDRARLLLDSLEARAKLRPGSAQDQAALAILQADLALARGRPADARTPLGRSSFDAYDALGFLLRAEMFESLGQLDSAVAMARTATERRRFGLETQMDWLRSFGTLARIAEAAGDSATARQAWSALLELWKDGDRDLLPLIQARRELTRLQAGASR